jgi:hypothetical protein
VHVIFWGAGWTQTGGPGPALREETLNFYKALSGSGSPSGRAYQGILTQYFDATGRIAPTLEKLTSFIDTSSPPPVNVNGAAIGREAREAAKAEGWVLGPNSQFVVMPGPGATYENGFAKFCAYHTVVGENSSYWTYTFVPYAGEPPFEGGCRSWDREFNAGHVQQMDAAHEYAESATDPAFSAWLDTEGEEVGDICAASDPLTENGKQTGVWVQGIWDDNQSACSLADEKPPHVLGLTEGPSNLGLHEATLNATVNAENEGFAAKYRFEYGPTTAYGKTAPAEGYVNIGRELLNQVVHQRLTGLPLGATVHYRVSATNSRKETMNGEDHTITPSEWSSGSVPLPPGTGQNSFGDALLSCSFYPWECGATSCPSPEECVAVGTYESSENIGGYNRELPMANTWKNGQWSVKALPIPEGTGKTVAMTGVSCTSTTACLAVGYEENTAGKRVPVAERLNGSEGWSASAISLPAGASEAALEGVSCASASACMAVGLSVNSTGGLVPYAALWNGSVWTAQNLNPPEGGNVALEGVSCPAAEYCVAVGYKVVGSVWAAVTETWNGTTWSPVSAEAPPGGGSFRFFGVSCASSTSCMAVGNYAASKGEASLTERWNGEKWSFQAAAETGVQEELTGVSCPTAQECTAVGYYNPNGRWVAMAQTWNGSAWSVQPLNTDAGGDPASEFHAVSCVAGSTCAAVGMSGWSAIARGHSAGGLRVLAEIRSTKPYVTGITPTAGGAAGGTSVTITGLGFVAPATVTIGGIAATSVEVVSESEIRAKTAAAPMGTYSVVVSDANGTSTGGPLYTYSAPTVTSIEPAMGRESGGTAVTIKGSNFVAPATVKIGNAATAVEVVSESEIKAKTTATAAGAYEVVVSDSNGTSSGGATYTYRANAATFLSAFGSAGLGSGGVGTQGVAVDGSGNVWVADPVNNRVDEFSSEGAFKLAFGWGVSNGAERLQTCTKSCRAGLTGSGPGEFGAHGAYFLSIGGIAVSGGDIWVVDGGNERIEEFTTAGQYTGRQIRTLLGPEAVATDSSGNNIWVSSYGYSALQDFSFSPTGTVEEKHVIEPPGNMGALAVDAQGNVWAAVSSVGVNPFNRLDEYSPQATFKQSLGWHVNKNGAEQFETCTSECLNGTGGSGEGQFNQPHGVAVDGHGDVFVADTNNNRFQEFLPTGKYITQFGSSGSGAAKFSDPLGIAVAGGRAYVVDAGNNRVEKWEVWENLPPGAVTGAASSITATSATLNATVNPNGSEVSACMLEYGATTSYGSSAPCTPSPGSGENPVAVSASVTGLTTATTYHFRVSATNAGGTSNGSDQTFNTP